MKVEDTVPIVDTIAGEAFIPGYLAFVRQPGSQIWSQVFRMGNDPYGPLCAPCLFASRSDALSRAVAEARGGAIKLIRIDFEVGYVAR